MKLPKLGTPSTTGSFEVDIPDDHQETATYILGEETEDWDNIFLNRKVMDTHRRSRLLSERNTGLPKSKRVELTKAEGEH